MVRKYTHEKLNELIDSIRGNYGLTINVIEDRPGEWCTPNIRVNGQIVLCRKSSYITVFAESIEKFAEATAVCILHELGHDIHFVECGRSHKVFYDYYEPIEREFAAWGFAQQELRKLPKHLAPSKKLFQKMMDVCMDDYKEEYEEAA